MIRIASFLFLFLLFDYHRSLLVLFALYANVHKMEVFLIFFSVGWSYLGCNCRTLDLVHPNAPLELLTLQVLESGIRACKWYHHVDAIWSEHLVDFSEHFAGVGVGTFSALGKRVITTTESKVPLSMTASKEFSANSMARTSICMYLKLGPLSL